LRFLRQLSIAETADQMSRSEKAVKFLQHSALRTLRRRLNGKEDSRDD
jgi:DNA-directed RNA polymerase specialized sigma24 family protein